MGHPVSSYARVLDDAITSTEPPPDILRADDPTAEGREWDLRRHDYDLATWEAEIIGPHGWEPITTTPRPPDTETTTHDYTLQLVDGVPTEVWTERPKTQPEVDAAEAAVNTTQMVAESDEAVDKLVLVVEALNAITALTNAEINANPAAIIKDLARECKTIARQANREARLTSGRTEDTNTGTDTGDG
jgi:hypothetical protein